MERIEPKVNSPRVYIKNVQFYVSFFKRARYSFSPNTHASSLPRGEML